MKQRNDCTPPRNNVQKQKAGRLRDYQVEVLDKLEGHPWRVKTDTHPQAGLFYVLALHAPAQVEAALQATQDKRLRNVNITERNVIAKARRYGLRTHRAISNNLTAYYIATVRNMCRERGIDIPVRWKE